MTTSGFNARLGDFIAYPGSQSLTPQGVRLAVTSVLDTISVAVAGSMESGTRLIEKTLLPPAHKDGERYLWLSKRGTPDQLALVLGSAAHALDYDDVIMSSLCHASAPVLAALLPLAATRTITGGELLDAFAVGTEVMIRLGEAMGFRHFSLGFHATGTYGAVGAAAACARLLKLDPQKAGTAVAIATSMSSGILKNFGSMTKPMHAGIAASNGVKAALLAQAGFSAADEAFEDNGFLRAMTGGDTDFAVAGLAFGKPFAIETPGFSLKKHPCCYLTHKLIAGGLQFHEMGYGLDDVRSIKAIMPQGGKKPLIHSRPRTGLHGKFSGEYTLLAALHDGRVNLSTFSDSSVQRVEIQARLRDVSIDEAGPTYSTGKEIGDAPVTLDAEMSDGRTVSVEIFYAPGAPEEPMSAAELLAKWCECFETRSQNRVDPLNSKAITAAFVAGQDLALMTDIAPWIEQLTKLCSVQTD